MCLDGRASFHFDAVIFVVATAGNGDPPRTMRATWRRLVQRSCPRLDGVRFAVFGLGDSTYPRFNVCAIAFHVRLSRVGSINAVGQLRE